MNTVCRIPPKVVLQVSRTPKGILEFLFLDIDGAYRFDIGALHILPRPVSSKYFEAHNIHAEHGWGPFLIDVAMEWVGQRGGWLYPDHQCVSHEARPMWVKYHNIAERPDVDRRQMSDIAAAALKVCHQEAELRCFYRKPVEYIAQLQASGQWDDRS